MTSPQRNGSTWLSILAMVGAFLAVAALSLFLWLSWGLEWEPALENRRHQLAFDTTIWKNQSADQGILWPTRLRVADDLLSSGRLNHLRRDQVIALLGPPDDPDSASSSQSFSYYLGPERGFLRIDGEGLVIRFNPAGRVEKIWIFRD